MPVEMNYLRKNARVSRLRRMRNESIRQRMELKEMVIQKKEKKGIDVLDMYC